MAPKLISGLLLLILFLGPSLLSPLPASAAATTTNSPSVSQPTSALAASKISAYPITLTSTNVQLNGYFGSSVAVSGTGAIVGAYDESVGTHSSAGRAYLYNAQTGALITALSSPNRQTGGEFGLSVATSGSLAIVGAPGESAGGFSGAGRAYVFNADTGSVVRNLTTPRAQTGGEFGNSVAISGTLAIVGAPYETVSLTTDAGEAYVFDTSSGALVRILDSPNPIVDGYFAYSVALSGTTAVVGAYDEASGGHAYVFDAETGALLQTLMSPAPQSGGDFGGSVGIDGTVAIIGAPGETPNPSYQYSGNAYVFNASTGALIRGLASGVSPSYNAQFGCSVSLSGGYVMVGRANSYNSFGFAYVFNSLTGTRVRTLSSLNFSADGGFGISAAISGNLVVVGAPGESAAGSADAGHAYVFSLPKVIKSKAVEPYGYFGSSVAISGSLALVGAYGETVGGHASAGRVYVLNAKTGAILRNLSSPNPETGGYFGYSVAISGSTAVIGAIGESSKGLISNGQAYVFNAKTGSRIATLVSGNAMSYGQFGYSVSTNGSVAVVGAPYETSGGQSDAGNAYSFKTALGTPIKSLASPSPEGAGFFGWSVSIGGTVAVIGAPGETSAGFSGGGNAYVINPSTGAKVSNLISPNPLLNENFGSSVSISGKMAGVGAPFGVPCFDCAHSGAAYLFNAKTGKPIATLGSSSTQNGGQFGSSIAVTGTNVIVGAANETAFDSDPPSGFVGAGMVYTFRSTSPYDGILVYASPNEQANGQFGYCVAINGKLAIAGSPEEQVGEQLCCRLCLRVLPDGLRRSSPSASLAQESTHPDG